MEFLIAIFLGLIFIALLVYGVFGKQFVITIRHENSREIIKPVQFEDLTEDEQAEVKAARAQYVESLKASEEMKGMSEAVQDMLGVGGFSNNEQK